MKAAFFVILCVLFTTIFGVPVYEQYNNYCYNIICPQEATGCKKEVRTLKDLRLIRTTVYCKNRYGTVLDTNVRDDYGGYQEGITTQSDHFTGTVSRRNNNYVSHF